MTLLACCLEEDLAMKTRRLRPLNTILQGLGAGLVVAASACAPTSSQATESASALARLEPASGTFFGVNLNWDTDSPAAYNQRLGDRAAIFVRFYQFPLSNSDIASLDATVKAVADQGGMLMVTLEPWNGLAGVTPEAAAALADRLAAANALGVPAFVRLAHEMNGSWYPWSQQPTAYVEAFRIVAQVIHTRAPQSAMLWAPNYGGGYPFEGGAFVIDPASSDFALLDTNQDGRLELTDDPYEPYYPGDDSVDWVGMSLYHWGGAYPWGENEDPETGKFAAQLTGEYNGQNGDERAVPDFYRVFCGAHRKPLAIPETAAFYDPARMGSDELMLKQLWWRQVLDPAFLAAYPEIKMINWFEWIKPEDEAGGALVDWRALGSPAIAEKFRADLPRDRLIFVP